MAENKLYFIAYTDDDCNNRDLIVYAPEPEDAFKLWCEHWSDGAASIEGGVNSYDDNFEPLTVLEAVVVPTDFVRIYEVTRDGSLVTALHWQSDELKIVAYTRAE